MCLLLIAWRTVPDAPLALAANREEAYVRGGTAPQLVPGQIRFVAGIDPVHGGTWLGINRHGLVVAVTNAQKSEKPASPRSRGLLVRDLLACSETEEAVTRAVMELRTGRYAGCNLFCADASSAYVIQGRDWLRSIPLPPGMHVLGRGDLNQLSDPRIQFALEWSRQGHWSKADDWRLAVEEFCRQNGTNGRPAICLTGENYGTVSSTLIVMRTRLVDGEYWHAQGPPDRTPYQDYSHLVKELA